jgi:sec-independent protein translocase protein TatB
MFDIGFSEMLLLGAIALIAIGPKQLPEVMRTFGRLLGQAKKLGGDFQRNLLEATENETINQIQTDVRAVAAAAAGDKAQVLGTILTESFDSPQMSLTPAATVALDEHRQMSFDFDKKES